MVLCWIVATYAGVDACAVCPTIHGSIVSIFQWVYFSLIGVFGSVTFASAYVSVTAVVVELCFDCVDSVNEGF